MRNATDLEVRLYRRVAKTETCWLWQGCVNNKGYGQIQLGRGIGNRLVHRVSYELANGPIAHGMYVLHSCDTPRCVRPSHLHVGSQAENIREMAARGRSTKGRYAIPPEKRRRGEQHWNSKITEDDAAYIRASRGRIPQKQLAQTFGISPATVSEIQRGLIWTHLTSQ